METLKRIKKPNCSVASIRMSIATWKLKRGVNYSQPKSSSVVSVFFFGGGGGTNAVKCGHSLFNTKSSLDSID